MANLNHVLTLPWQKSYVQTINDQQWCPKKCDLSQLLRTSFQSVSTVLDRAQRAGKELVSLELSDNPMTAAVSDELVTTVKAHPSLRSLILNDILLCENEDSEGLEKICEALKDCAPELEELELALNEITAEGARVQSSLPHIPENVVRMDDPRGVCR